MYFNIPLALTAAATLLGISSAAVMDVAAREADATQNWSFIIYQSTKCSTADGNITQSGSGSANCGPPLEYYYGSVLVTNNANGNCKIQFGTEAEPNKPHCGDIVGSSPGTITKGKCYSFPSGHPTVYNVACS